MVKNLFFPNIMKKRIARKELIMISRIIKQNGNRVFEIDGKKFFITHGHVYGVKSSLTSLKKRAEQNDADCVLFGHTHISLCEKDGKTFYLNPGSARETAGVIEIENGKISGCIINI